MKDVVRLLILFICFITIQSEAQRGWRFFEGFSVTEPVIRSSASNTITLVNLAPSSGGAQSTVWRYGENDVSGWLQIHDFGRGEIGVTLLESDDGVLWIGSSQGLMSYYHNSGLPLSHESYDPKGLQGNLDDTSFPPVRTLHQDFDGHLWVGTQAGLWIVTVGQLRSS